VIVPVIVRKYGGDCTGHCEEIRVIADWISKNKSIVNSNKQREIAVNLIVISIHCLNINLLQFTVMSENPTVNLSALCNWCVKILCCPSELIFTFLYAASSNQTASERLVCSIHLYFVNFSLHPTPQTKLYRVRTGVSYSTISATNQN